MRKTAAQEGTVGLEQDHCPVLVLPRSPQPVVQVQSLKSFSRALARSSRGSCGHTRVQGLCLAAGPRVPLGLEERTWHIRACTRGVHGHVHSAGYTRAGSRRFGGQEPGRLGAPGAALGEQEQRTRRGRGWPGPAVIGCWGGEGKAWSGGDWPRPPRGPSRPKPEPQTAAWDPPASSHLRRRGQGAG